MKIAKLDLEKYGLYENRSIEFRADASLHVIVGANEAGKTSALSAIGDLLFGFNRSRREFDFKFDAGSLRLGGVVRLSDGKVLEFRRRRGAKNVLVDAQDKAIGDDLLDPVIGTISRQDFDLEFGLTAERLRAGGEALLAADGSLAESLIAGSAGLSALSDWRAEMQYEADEIFTVRKTASKKFYIAADAYGESARKLREAIVTAESVKAARDECAQIAEQEKSLDDEHDSLTRALHRLRRAASTAAKLRQLSEREQELAGLKDLPDVEPGVAMRWREAFQLEAETRKQIEDVQRQVTANQEAIGALIERPELLDVAGDIAAAVHARGGADQSRQHLPNREQARNAAWSRLEIAAGTLGLKSPQDLLDNMPTRPKIAGIRELLQQRRNRESQRESFEEQLEKARKQLAALESESGERSHAVDPAELERAFESFQDVPADASAVRSQTADIKQELRDIDLHISRLTPSPPPLQDLIRMALPDAASVEAARNAHARHARELEDCDESLSSALSEIDATERELKRLDQAGDIVTRDGLDALRSRRDGIIAALRKEDAIKPRERNIALADLNAVNADIDRMTDSLLANADRAARKYALEHEIADSRERIKQLRQQKSDLVAAGTVLDEQWRAQWAGVEIEPASPDAMTKWLAEVNHAVARYDGLAAKKKTMAAVQAKLQEQAEPLGIILGKLGIEALEKLPVDQLYEDVRKGLAALRERWTDRRLHAQKIEDAALLIQNHEAELQRLAGEEELRKTDWAAAMQGLCCSENAGASEANEALRIWDEAISDSAKYQDEVHRLSGIRETIADFESRVSGLCEKIAPDLVESDAFLAVDHLTARLQDAREVARELAHLRKGDAGLTKQLADLEQRHKVSLAELGEAGRQLAVPDQDSIGPALERLQRRDVLVADMSSITSDLSSMADGLTVSELRTEQAGLDPEAIPGEIARLEVQAAEVLDKIKLAAGAASRAKQALETLTAGRNAAALAQEKEEAASELLDLSRRWLVRAAAARLGTQAIEQYRQSTQDPVIARASELFAHATGGAYERLGVQFGDDDKPVFAAVRSGEQFVSIAGLSDGTRDQLFLALRLALLEQRRGESLPFIGDDILTSFDEVRTAQAIEMLAEFGQVRQTILFSHHRHVAEIAQMQLKGGLDLIEL